MITVVVIIAITVTAVGVLCALAARYIGTVDDPEPQPAAALWHPPGGVHRRVDTRRLYRGDGGLSFEDTGTLAVMRAINARHDVTPHEPAAGQPGKNGSDRAGLTGREPFRSLPSPPQPDRLDALIARWSPEPDTTCDPVLPAWVTDELGFGSVDCYLDAWDARRRQAA